MNTDVLVDVWYSFFLGDLKECSSSTVQGISGKSVLGDAKAVLHVGELA